MDNGIFKLNIYGLKLFLVILVNFSRLIWYFCGLGVISVIMMKFRVGLVILVLWQLRCFMYFCEVLKDISLILIKYRRIHIMKLKLKGIIMNYVKYMGLFVISVKCIAKL